MSTFNAGAIESTLTLNRSTWNAELKKLQREIDKLENTTITIGIDADTDNAYIAMDNLERQLDFLDAQTYEPNVDLNTAHATTTLRQLELRLNNLDANTATVTVDADITNFEVGLSNAELFLESFDKQRATATINVDVDTGAALAELAELDAAIELVDGRDIDVQADVDIGAGLAEIGLLDAAISAVDGRDIDVDMDYDEDTFDRLVGPHGGSGGGHMGLLRLLIYGLIALSPLLAVAISSGFAAIIAFTAALAAALGPALLLGGALVGLALRFKDADPSDYTPGMQALADSLEALSDAYNHVLDAIAPQGFQLMADAIGLVADILPDFIPLLKSTMDMFDGILRSVQAFTQSSDYDEMLAFFGGFGVDMLEDFLKIGGNLLVFFGNLFDAISPLAKLIMDDLVGITDSWADWSQGLSDNPAFQEFMDDAIMYGPMVLDMLGSLFQALVNIGDALEPFAGPLITHLTTFFDAIANMDTDQLTILLGILGGIFAFMQVGMPLINAFVAAWPILATALGIIFSPLGALILLLAGLAGVIYYLWTTNEEFRQGIIDTWNNIRDTIMPIVTEIWGIIQDNWGPMKEWILTLWADIQTMVISAMLVIEDIVKIALAIVEWLWNTTGANLVQIVTGVVQIIGAVIGGLVKILGDIFTIIHAVLTGQWGKAWEAIMKLEQDFIDMIVGILNGFGNIVGGIFGAIGDAIESAWDNTFGKNGKLRINWNAFENWLRGMWQSAINWAGNLFASIGGAIGDAWGAVFGADGFLRTKWNDFKTWIEGRWDAMITWLGGLGARIKTATLNIWDGIGDAFKDVINNVIGWWNNLSFFIDLPDKLPGLPDSITISTPNVPTLASGGLVNEETLAVIGEGNEPEIVSPISTMREIVREVIHEGGSPTNTGDLAMALASALREVAPEMRMDVDELANAIAERMLPSLNVDLHSDDDTPAKFAEELMFWLRTMGYGGKYNNAA